MWQEISLHIGAIDIECLLTIAPREQVLSAAALGFICFCFCEAPAPMGGPFLPARRGSFKNIRDLPMNERFESWYQMGFPPLIRKPNKNGEPNVINNGGPVGAKSIAFCRAVMASSTVGTAQQGGEAGCDQQQHVGRGGRNPSVRSHKTTKSFESWLAVKICCGLLQILWKISQSQVSSNMFESTMKFLKTSMIGVNESMVWKLAGLDANSGTIWWGGGRQSCSALAQQILLKIWNQKDGEVCSYCYFSMIFIDFLKW